MNVFHQQGCVIVQSVLYTGVKTGKKRWKVLMLDDVLLLSITQTSRYVEL